jgi:hypothetical protein
MNVIPRFDDVISISDCAHPNARTIDHGSDISARGALAFATTGRPFHAFLSARAVSAARIAANA